MTAVFRRSLLSIDILPFRCLSLFIHDCAFLPYQDIGAPSMASGYIYIGAPSMSSGYIYWLSMCQTYYIYMSELQVWHQDIYIYIGAPSMASGYIYIGAPSMASGYIYIYRCSKYGIRIYIYIYRSSKYGIRIYIYRSSKYGIRIYDMI